MSQLDQEEQNNLEAVKTAMQRFAKHCSENSLMDREKVDIDLHLEDASKVSTISYESPEGSFSIKYNPKKKTASAKVDWMTGAFKSTVTEDAVKTKGDDPVYHNRWGILHSAFTHND